MRVLGIDPGSRRTGLGVVEADGDRLRRVGGDCIIDARCAIERAARRYLSRRASASSMRMRRKLWRSSACLSRAIRVRRWCLGKPAAVQFAQPRLPAAMLSNTARCKLSARWSARARRISNKCSTWCAYCSAWMRRRVLMKPMHWRARFAIFIRCRWRKNCGARLKMHGVAIDVV